MTIADSRPRPSATTPAIDPGAAPRQSTKLRILAALDGSEAAGRVVKCLIGLNVDLGSIEVALLNVQPMPQEWRLRGYGWFQREAIHDRLVNDLGQRIIASAARHLDGAGIAHTDYIEVGDPAEIILRHAHEQRCDLIVLAEPQAGTIRTWLMRRLELPIGSLLNSIVQGARVPVVVAPPRLDIEAARDAAEARAATAATA